MAILYYPQGNLLAGRNSANAGYEQLIIANNPSTVFYFGHRAYRQRQDHNSLRLSQQDKHGR